MICSAAHKRRGTKEENSEIIETREGKGRGGGKKGKFPGECVMKRISFRKVATKDGEL